VPAGQQTMPSVPPATPAAPRPAGPRPGAPRPNNAGFVDPPKRRAVPVSADDARAAYHGNPASVHRSVSHDWHEQMWRLDRGNGAPPPAFRSGSTIIVDPDFPLEGR
jgi:hypothetical protein